ncbi:MAG: transport system ATP-binding/permease protein [Frankiaceae bacterium]|nr:transport system ATP-binding/permease protein [Frankiaceae bacterium]
MAVSLVNLENVTKSYGTATPLDGVSLGVAFGERVGVVGRNGHGKSTLVRMLTRMEAPDSGRVTHTGGVTVGVLAQHDALNPSRTVREIVLHDRPEHVWAGDARVRSVLAALLPEGDFDRVVGPMSGGERRRVALAALLVDDPDLLVLDEPTNHLDIEAITWLAGHLRERKGALVVVTHDRWFLDEVSERTWEVVGGKVEQYDGGYSSYVLAKAERDRIAAVDESRRKNLMRKELAWLRRGPPARTSKPRFRIEAANALIADEPPARDKLELERFATARLGKNVLDIEDVDLALGDRTLLRRVTWRLGPGDRVGVVGANGSGKTSLLRLLTGELRPGHGRVKRGLTIKVAYLSQEIAEIDPEQRVLPAVEEIARSIDLGRGRSASASQLLERFGFTADKQWAPVADLSGGERRRLQLLRLLMGEPNVLLLDEPTNDLDIEVLQVLEDLLDGWSGTLVVVSHDRFFLERVTDAVYALPGDGSLRHLPRGVDQYLELRGQAAPVALSNPPVVRSAGDTRAAKKELARVERQIEKLTAREAALHDELALHAAEYEKVAVFDSDLRAVVAERERLEERWLELSD